MIRTARLGDVCDMRSGGTPRRGVEGYYGGSIPWVTIADMSSSDGVVRDTAEQITDAGLAAIGNRLFEPGTILLAMYGSVGKLAVAGSRLATNQAILGLKSREPKVLDPRYLKRWLGSIQARLVFDARGVTQANISKGLVEELRIPLPPLPEQRRIADILDKADAIRRKRKEAIALTEELLRSAFLDMFGDPVTNPKGWPVKPLGEIATSIDYGVTASANAQPVGPHFLRITDIQDNRVNWSSVPYCECDPATADRARLSSGDIVFARTGATTGKSFWIRDCPAEAVFASYLIRVKPGHLLLPAYLSEFFQSAGYWAQVRAMAQGAAQPGVNASKLASLKVPVPPLAAQRRLANVSADVLRLQTRAECAATVGETLFNSLVVRAFSGALYA